MSEKNKEKLKADYEDLKKLGTSDADAAQTLGFKSVGDMQVFLEITPNRVVERELPVYMRRGANPLLVGEAIVKTTAGVGTTAVVSLNTPEGIEMGELLSSKLVSGISIGGIMDTKVMEQLKRNN
ncbi:hypothetical protein SEA_ARCADIA_67 [Arthrobacter phage Arcadia]|uniref:Uncharacterized protein n=2 Tax=Mudcatvirus TaxID=1982088 RepID=A0A222Z7K8_9CAUD|nr:hypothetical protein PQB74_gp67 [Arthrobacter phage Arcadia]YP_010666447.1 hypothetical protein PQB78_gp63 [Arthrobacter phage Xenomorph]ASR80223.1 hypothetical protein SEA_ELSA_67 [Arthrobacter phage Elsa]ASR80420.1 hypothetical protein SEA_NASON_67 [Arthrobacter phage Nason]ASR80030.1 hypothetical protein SEA_ARCADIA_67 [Arthrobacter phage Arcadia]QDH47976.1 hypothetical protein SEA_XENOMORPH_63 [Arthrobacter phage Xenomorph]